MPYRRTPRELTGSTPRELGVQESFKLDDVVDSDLSDDSLDSIATPREPSGSFNAASAAARRLSPREDSVPQHLNPAGTTHHHPLLHDIFFVIHFATLFLMSCSTLCVFG